MDINIRQEMPKDGRSMEEAARKAFWACMEPSACGRYDLAVSGSGGASPHVSGLGGASPFVPESGRTLPFASESGEISLFVPKAAAGDPACSLIRTKDQISLYRVEAGGKRYVLKVFGKQEDAREIDNYLLLKELGIMTLPLLGHTANAIVLPDVTVSEHYRLGTESDMSDPKAARAAARWYKKLHERGREWLSGSEKMLYDESDVITWENMERIAERTGTKEHALWKVLGEHFSLLRSRIDALPRTLTYNDFWWTNLIVAKDMESAFMFDYNLLGKGTAYGDIRNVTCALSSEAAEAFREEYGIEGMEEQALADSVISPLVTLSFACERESFPGWAQDSLEALKNGDILKKLSKWLEL